MAEKEMVFFSLYFGQRLPAILGEVSSKIAIGMITMARGV